MNFDLTAAIQTIQSQNGAFILANGAVPGAAYRLAQFLPEQNREEYFISNSTMTIRATMAGMVGMDSPYPPGGAIDTSTFKENTVKIANEVELPETILRQLQQMLLRLNVGGGNGNQRIVQTALNFLDKIIIQSHLDTAEWMRGQALSTGAISWTFGNLVLSVDYGIPAGNFLTARTGNDGYGGSSSKFWTDVRSARAKLNGTIRAFIISQNTKEMILANSANNLRIVTEDQTSGDFSVERWKIVGGVPVPTDDARDRATFMVYNREGEVLDLVNPGQTIKVPFFPDGVIVAIGNFVQNRFVIGQGGTQPVANPSNPLVGYTHIAPTVEGGGTPGRWAELFVPETRKYTFGGHAVTNLLPVIDGADRIVILTTEMV